MERVGRVIKKRVSSGTKSEHEAVVFVTDSGEYKLRRRGGNPFVDHELEKLIGKRIRASGVVDSGQLILTEWCEVE